MVIALQVALHRMNGDLVRFLPAMSEFPSPTVTVLHARGDTDPHLEGA